MCNFASFVFDRDSVYWSKDGCFGDDPHTRIREENNLGHETSCDPKRIRFAQAELVPPGSDLAAPLSKWKYQLDGPAPSWYDAERDEARVRAAMKRRMKEIVIPAKGTYAITSGFRIVRSGSPTIVLSGGELRTYDQSAPKITQSGGVLCTFDKSAPRITQSGGWLRTYDQSAPKVTQSDGYLHTYSQSAPRITQSDGWLYTCDQSAPVVTQSGGWLYTYGQFAPKVKKAKPKN